MNLCKAGGSKTFLKLIEIAKLESPLEKSTVESIVNYVNDWILSVNKEFEYDQIS